MLKRYFWILRRQLLNIFQELTKGWWFFLGISALVLVVSIGAGDPVMMLGSIAGITFSFLLRFIWREQFLREEFEKAINADAEDTSDPT